MALSRNPLLFRAMQGKPGLLQPQKKPASQKTPALARARQLSALNLRQRPRTALASRSAVPIGNARRPQLRLQRRSPLTPREQAIRRRAIQAERNAVIRRLNFPFEQRLRRVGVDVKAGKLPFNDGATIIEGINAQREILLRRLGLK